MKTVAVLGATGSIGRQALEIVAAHPDLRACALSAHASSDALVAAARAHGVGRIALADEDAARAVRGFDGEVLAGEAGVERLVRESGADIVLNAIVGAAGLRASLAALESGAELALANKESLVAGGDVVTAAAARAGRAIVPVDSEHSALAQCLAGWPRESVSGLVVTASGGPFRGRGREELAGVAPEEALAHPTWRMGAKITIDSATLMNKGLEVIEAHQLFGIPYERIEVVVHPQSIVHGLVRFCDGALLAHVGHPDMRVPISYALTGPERTPTGVPSLDLSAPLSLEFEPVDEETFACLRLAREAGSAGGGAPCVLSAANEVAVAAFLRGGLGFLEIADVVARVLEQVEPGAPRTLEEVLELDARARRAADEAVGALV